MSRTTTDDCLVNCPNHFNLAYHAAQRAHQIMRRGDAQVPLGDDKSIVLALREIAKGLHVVMPLIPEKPPTEETSAATELAAESATATTATMTDASIIGE